MGKLNYANRKVEGAKLGQVVAKDLMKRVTPGSTSKAALRDPYVEIDVSGRQLTNEGFAEIASALSSSIAFEGDLGRVVRLEELHLAGNGLTTGCLHALGGIIRHTADDLRELDLSDNDITVTECDEVLDWEVFLRSFRKCSVLRRLNFSGNALGPRAFEILAKVYGEEDPLDFSIVEEDDSNELEDDTAQAKPEGLDGGVGSLETRTRNMTVVNESEEQTQQATSDSTEGTKRRNSRKDSSASKTAHPHSTHAVDPQSSSIITHGLRSVPYIIFSNTAMTDLCALHLSYIVENHSLPEQLLPHVPAGKAGPLAQQLESNDATAICQGIIYLPNAKLGSAGTKVLGISELVRKGEEDEFSDADESQPKLPSVQSTDPRRISDAGFSPISVQAHGRRRSTVSSGNVPHFSYAGGTPSVASELDRARSRIQSNVLKECGPNCVELWSASLKMLNIARHILLEKRRSQSQGGNFNLENNSPTETKARTTYASKLMVGNPVPGEPILAITGVSNEPTTPTIMHTRKLSTVATATSRRHLHSPRSGLETKPIKLVIDTSPEQSQMPFGLPEPLWRRIIALASDATSVVSTTQQYSILHWARDRNTLCREREMLGKSESAQIWRVLEGLGCLSYEVRT